MTKLVRKYHKVFGATATEDKVGQFGSANLNQKIETKDIDEIQALEAWDKGWEAGTIGENRYPSLQERNGVDYEHSYQTGYILQEGIPEWNEQTEYHKGSVVKVLIGNQIRLYVSIVDFNIGHALSESDYWQESLDANVDLSNLTEAGEKHFLNKSQITNCLLEVPQRIKYDLTDGTLTIKAGSVVIVPYGTEDKTSELPVGATFINDNFKVYDTQYTEDAEGNGKFFVWAELVNDISHQQSTTEVVTRLISINFNMGNNVPFAFNAKTSSGATAPPTTHAYQWYDTANNKCVHTNKTTGDISLTLLSLPFGIVTSTETEVIGSIDQIFNGIGYIGSTVWVDKGVKGLIPNGRNQDETLKNIEYVPAKILMYDVTKSFGAAQPLTLMVENDNSLGATNSSRCLSGYSLPSTVSNTNYHLFYNIRENKYYRTSGSTTANWVEIPKCIVGEVYFDGTNITSFNPKQPFRAVDYSELPITDICTTKATTASTATQKKPAVVVQNYVSDTSWYRVWSDGWIEQGGYILNLANNASVTVKLLKSFKNTQYNITIGQEFSTKYIYESRHLVIEYEGKTSSSFKIRNTRFNANELAGISCSWRVCGY